MHKALTEEGLGTAGRERGERDQESVCVMPRRTTVLNWEKGRKIVCKNDSFKKISNIQSNNTVSCSFLMDANTGWSGSVTSESPLPRRMDRPSSRAKTSEFWFWHECLTTSLGVENVLSHKLHL